MNKEIIIVGCILVVATVVTFFGAVKFFKHEFASKTTASQPAK